MRKKLPLALALCVLFAGEHALSQTKTGLAAASAFLDAADYAKAKQELAQIKGAEEAQAQLLLARVHTETGQLAEAEKAAEAAERSPALKIAAVTARARVLALRGKRPEAMRLLEGVTKTGKGSDVRRARLLLGELRIDAGRRSDADDPLKAVIDDYNDSSIADTDAEGLATVGRALHLMRSAKEANKIFNKSEAADKKRVETMLWRAELFLDKYDPGHAEEVVKEGLAIAPKRADLLVAMARVKLEQTLDFDAAEALVKDALAVNPAHVGAYAVKAGVALRDMDLAGADAAIGKGLEIDPNDLELLSLRAAARFLGDDKAGWEKAKAEVFQRNKEYANFYTIVGAYAEWEHRYDDIVAMMKEAVKVDPDDGKAWAELGLTQMRNGDEKDGLDAITKAWSKDKFNVRVFNTLNLYEQTIPNQYDTGTEGVFRIRYPKDEKPVLERYVPALMSEAWASMKARYGFVPKNPVQIELYAGREPFSVRTSGLPNIGIQGVCFGRVVAAMSPKSEAFNWGNVLWHELGHVFAIQLSKNHVPRWFTEGLSEYETIARRPEWARELDPQLFVALRDRTLPGAVDMNRAFTHASNGEDVTVAYYAASQMLVWTVEAFGMPRVVEALRLWGEGLRTPEVIQKSFGVSAADYDARFRAWAEKRLDRYRGQYIFSDRVHSLEDAKKAAEAAPNDAKKQAMLGLALLKSKKPAEAKKALDRALALDPKQMDAHYIYARVAAGEKDVPAATRHLDAIRAAGGDGYVVQTMLGNLAEAGKDKAKLRFALEAAHRWDPTQTEALGGLLEMAIEEKREGDAVAILEKLALLEQHDRKVYRALLEKLVEQKAWDRAVRLGESAMFVDVLSGGVHVTYARALVEKGMHDRALYELETALVMQPKDKEAATVHALMARAYAGKKDVAEAKKHRDLALSLDKDNADAAGLKL